MTNQSMMPPRLAERYRERHPTRTYDFVDWDSFYPQFARTWRQGEHVAIVGPTGCGKTTLESYILPVRQYVVVFVTKVHDDVLSSFPTFERITKWPPKLSQDRVLLWPKYDRRMSVREIAMKQRQVFQHALNRIFREKGWCVAFDEQHYMCKVLRLEPENAMFLHQGRSSGLSVVNGTQRPAHVPLVTYSSATHAFLWNTNVDGDLKRLGDLGGVNSRELASNIQTLGKHEFVYLNCRTGDVCKSQVRGK